MSDFNLELDSLVLSLCQKNLDPKKSDSICCDKCKRRFHLIFSGRSKRELNFIRLTNILFLVQTK